MKPENPNTSNANDGKDEGYMVSKNKQPSTPSIMQIIPVVNVENQPSQGKYPRTPKVESNNKPSKKQIVPTTSAINPTSIYPTPYVGNPSFGTKKGTDYNSGGSIRSTPIHKFFISVFVSFVIVTTLTLFQNNITIPESLPVLISNTSNYLGFLGLVLTLLTLMFLFYYERSKFNEKNDFVKVLVALGLLLLVMLFPIEFDSVRYKFLNFIFGNRFVPITDSLTTVSMLSVVIGIIPLYASLKGSLDFTPMSMYFLISSIQMRILDCDFYVLSIAFATALQCIEILRISQKNPGVIGTIVSMFVAYLLLVFLVGWIVHNYSFGAEVIYVLNMTVIMFTWHLRYWISSLVFLVPKAVLRSSSIIFVFQPKKESMNYIDVSIFYMCCTLLFVSIA